MEGDHREDTEIEESLLSLPQRERTREHRDSFLGHSGFSLARQSYQELGGGVA
jgi:hypothetical protein